MGFENASFAYRSSPSPHFWCDRLFHRSRVLRLQSKHLSVSCHSSPLLHTSPHFSLLYISKAEYRRRHLRAVVLDQGLLRTVRRVDEWGDASPPQPNPRPETALSCFSIANCLFLFSLLSQIHTISFTNNQRLSSNHCSPFIVHTTTKPNQRPARHNHKLAATNRPFGLCAFHNRQRSRIPRF
jgi:hypothetical protein